jgi:hypothetical protein
MSQTTLPVLTHPEFPQVLTKAIEHAFQTPDEARKEHNAALLIALWNAGRVLTCSLCGMQDGKPGRVHVIAHENLCLPCARELFE